MWQKIISLVIALILVPSLCFSGIDFDGVDDYVNSVDVDITGSLSISCWIKIDANVTGMNQSLIGKQIGSGILIFIRDDHPTTVFRRTIDFFVGQDNISTTQLSFGTWYNIVGTHSDSGDETAVYINGVKETLQLGGANTNNLTTDTETWKVAADFIGGVTDYMDGNITDVAVWNGLLTQAEITQLASSRIKRMPLQIQTANLKIYYPMDDGVDGTSADLDTVKDLSGNGNNGNPDNGANNTGLSWQAETILSYP